MLEHVRRPKREHRVVQPRHSGTGSGRRGRRGAVASDHGNEGHILFRPDHEGSCGKHVGSSAAACQGLAEHNMGLDVQALHHYGASAQHRLLDQL